MAPLLFDLLSWALRSKQPREGYTLQSLIIGKRLRETAPAGRAKLRREFRVPISNNYARFSICLYLLEEGNTFSLYVLYVWMYKMGDGRML